MSENNRAKRWLGITIAQIGVVGALLVLVAILNGEESGDLARITSAILTMLSLLAAAVSCFAVFKVRGWLKVVPLVAVLLHLGIAFLAYFAYWIGGYPS